MDWKELERLEMRQKIDRMMIRTYMLLGSCVAFIFICAIILIYI